MMRTVRAVFDGTVLRPEQPIDLEPNTTYLITIEREEPTSEASQEQAYVLTEISRLATDMGVADLSTRHDWYAHRRAED